MIIVALGKKGGICKTTTVINAMAAAIAQNIVKKGCVVDLDAEQHSAWKYRGSIPNVEFTKALPGAHDRKSLTIVDTSPGSTTEIRQALEVADLILIPCTPEKDALDTLKITFNLVRAIIERRKAMGKKDEVKVRLMFARVDGSARTQGILMTAEALSEWPMLNTVIPRRHADFERAAAEKRSVVLNSPRSAGAQAYKDLMVELKEVLQ